MIVAPGGRRRRSWAVAVSGGAAVVLLAGCSSAPRGLPDQRPTVTKTVAVTRCPTSARVPSTSINATPSRGTPATVVVAVGDAVTVPAADATHVRVFGTGATRSAADEVCLGPTRPGSSTLLALRPGYVRIVVSSGRTQRLLYLKITS